MGPGGIRSSGSRSGVNFTSIKNVGPVGPTLGPD